ncbi:hypothetical protein GG344DRAFT_70781 [Lentinula edodes]|nr:hypothetical protein GG344DRAFT_70781 [Lentinula edodes]
MSGPSTPKPSISNITTHAITISQAQNCPHSHPSNQTNLLPPNTAPTPGVRLGTIAAIVSRLATGLGEGKRCIEEVEDEDALTTHVTIENCLDEIKESLAYITIAQPTLTQPTSGVPLDSGATDHFFHHQEAYASYTYLFSAAHGTLQNISLDFNSKCTGDSFEDSCHLVCWDLVFLGVAIFCTINMYESLDFSVQIWYKILYLSGRSHLHRSPSPNQRETKWREGGYASKFGCPVGTCHFGRALPTPRGTVTLAESYCLTLNPPFEVKVVCANRCYYGTTLDIERISFKFLPPLASSHSDSYNNMDLTGFLEVPRAGQKRTYSWDPSEPLDSDEGKEHFVKRFRPTLENLSAITPQTRAPIDLPCVPSVSGTPPDMEVSVRLVEQDQEMGSDISNEPRSTFSDGLSDTYDNTSYIVESYDEGKLADSHSRPVDHEMVVEEVRVECAMVEEDVDHLLAPSRLPELLDLSSYYQSMGLEYDTSPIPSESVDNHVLTASSQWRGSSSDPSSHESTLGDAIASFQFDLVHQGDERTQPEEVPLEFVHKHDSTASSPLHESSLDLSSQEYTPAAIASPQSDIASPQSDIASPQSDPPLKGIDWTHCDSAKGKEVDRGIRTGEIESASQNPTEYETIVAEGQVKRSAAAAQHIIELSRAKGDSVFSDEACLPLDPFFKPPEVTTLDKQDVYIPSTDHSFVQIELEGESEVSVSQLYEPSTFHHSSNFCSSGQYDATAPILPSFDKVTSDSPLKEDSQSSHESSLDASNSVHALSDTIIFPPYEGYPRAQSGTFGGQEEETTVEVGTSRNFADQEDTISTRDTQLTNSHLLDDLSSNDPLMPATALSRDLYPESVNDLGSDELVHSYDYLDVHPRDMEDVRSATNPLILFDSFETNDSCFSEAVNESYAQGFSAPIASSLDDPPVYPALANPNSYEASQTAFAAGDPVNDVAMNYHAQFSSNRHLLFETTYGYISPTRTNSLNDMQSEEQFYPAPTTPTPRWPSRASVTIEEVLDADIYASHSNGLGLNEPILRPATPFDNPSHGSCTTSEPHNAEHLHHLESLNRNDADVLIADVNAHDDEDGAPQHFQTSYEGVQESSLHMDRNADPPTHIRDNVHMNPSNEMRLDEQFHPAPSSPTTCRPSRMSATIEEVLDADIHAGHFNHLGLNEPILRPATPFVNLAHDPCATGKPHPQNAKHLHSPGSFHRNDADMPLADLNAHTDEDGAHHHFQTGHKNVQEPSPLMERNADPSTSIMDNNPYAHNHLHHAEIFGNNGAEDELYGTQGCNNDVQMEDQNCRYGEEGISIETVERSYDRGLSPLTEIPDTPKPRNHTFSNDDEAFNSLRGELASLIQNAVKSSSMVCQILCRLVYRVNSQILFQKAHFILQMNDPAINLVTLRGILDRCYRYIGAIPEHNTASPDADDDDGHLSVDSGPSPKLYRPPKHRSEGKNYLADRVRYATAKLLGILDTEDRAKPRIRRELALATVRKSVAKEFRRTNINGPTIDNFVLELDNGLRTNWNKAAAEVFTKHFRSMEGHQNYRSKDVYEAFISHLTQLKRDYERQGKNKSIEEADDDRRARRLARRQARRIEAFRDIFRYHPGPLGELAELIRRLTLECMSGDETGSGDKAHRKFYKTKVKWRSQELTEFLNMLSAWHLCGRYLGGGKYSPGIFPHSRYSTNRIDAVLKPDAATSQFPINWYDPAWLEEHEDVRSTLSPQPATSLKLPESIAREARRFLSVKTRRDWPLPPSHPYTS